jgi:hypothetical protein
MAQIVRTDDERVALSRWLLHDVQVFFGVTRSLVRIHVGFDPPPAWEVRVAQVESFAVHARALTDFFFKRTRSQWFEDDALAGDFFDHASGWRKFAEEPGPWLKRVQYRPKDQPPSEIVDLFGSHIGHLNFRREPIADVAQGWPPMQVAAELGTLLDRFVDAVDDARVAPDFKTKARREIPVASLRVDDPLAMALWTPLVRPEPRTA